MTREESFAKADRRLAAAYQQYTLEELRWDWRSKISERSREILKAELVRRKVVKAVNKIYVSLAHTDKDVDETIEIFDQALAVIAAGA